MPEEDKKNMEEQNETSEETAKKGKSPIMKYGMYAGILIVIVIAAYFVTLKVVKPMMTGGEEPATEDVAQIEEDDQSSDEGGHGSHGESDDGGKAESDIYLIDDIIVNPAGTGGRRFLSASVGFEMDSKKISELMAQRDAVVRDALITILSAQSVPQLSDFKQREYLRKIIKRRVEKLLGSDDIGAVYFTQFVLQ